MNSSIGAFYERLSNSGDTNNIITRTDFFEIQFYSPNIDNEKDLIKQKIEQSALNDKLILFAQSVDLPSFQITDGPESIISDFGQISFAGEGNVIPGSSKVVINFLSTEISVHEQLFYEWLKEVGSNIWVYTEIPFTKAIIEIVQRSSLDNSIIGRYKLYGAFPHDIGTPQFSQVTNNEFVRPVSFVFNNMTYKQEVDTEI